MSKSNQPSDAKGAKDAKATKAEKAEKAQETETLEQPQVVTESSTEKAVATTKGVFKALDTQTGSGDTQHIDMILDIPVRLSVELGHTRMSIRELLRLAQGSVVALHGLAGEPLDILINGYLIASGEVVVVGDKYGVRITNIITPSERMKRLSQ